MLDPYLYPGTEILKNRFNMLDENQLETIEADYAGMRLRELAISPLDGCFDFEHLCCTHQYIFQDLYDWAGKPRSIGIEKYEPVLGGLSIEYSDPWNIKSDAQKVLNELRSVSWDTLDIDQKAERFAKLMASLWKVHPFREGNTRSVVTFCCQFADCQSFPLDTALFKDNSAYVRTALVAASAQFADLGDRSQPQHIIRIVKDAIQRMEKQKRVSLSERLKNANQIAGCQNKTLKPPQKDKGIER